MTSTTATVSSSSVESQQEAYLSWSRERLSELVDSTRKANEILKIETEMFQRHFKNIETCVERERLDINVKDKAHSNLVTLDQSVSHSSPRTRPARHPVKSGGRRFEKLLKLKAEDKCEIAIKEMEHIREVQKKHICEAEKAISHLKAIVEEAAMHDSDIKREEYEFQRDVSKEGINSQNGKVGAEKVVRYFDDRMKAKENYIGKLRMKSQALWQQNKRAAMLLKQKEEIGDVLTEIDFQQLQIENSDRIEQIEERNKDFFRLKTNGTITVHVLNHYKKKLDRLMRESTLLKQDIHNRQVMVSRLDAETRLCKAERAKAAVANRKRRQNITCFKVPVVMDAVKLKSELEVLSGKVLIWERKISIAEMAYAAQKKRWSKIQLRVANENDAARMGRL